MLFKRTAVGQPCALVSRAGVAGLPSQLELGRPYLPTQQSLCHKDHAATPPRCTPIVQTAAEAKTPIKLLRLDTSRLSTVLTAPTEREPALRFERGPSSSAWLQSMEVHTVPPEDPRLERCGFCKLYGPELEFYSKRYDIQIGRRSKSTKLDVVLGGARLSALAQQHTLDCLHKRAAIGTLVAATCTSSVIDRRVLQLMRDPIRGAAGLHALNLRLALQVTR